MEKKFLSKGLLPSFIIVVFIFSLWGFVNDFTNPMVEAFRKIMDINNKTAYYVQLFFYLGYGVMAIPSALFIRKYSYKSGILVGLAFFALGTFLFFPAYKIGEYGAYLVSFFIITCGLSFLETSANPLIISMGDKETGTMRINLAQSFNPIGSMFAIISAKFFVLNNLYSMNKNLDTGVLNSDEIKNHDLEIISNRYIFLGLACLFIFSLVFFFVKKLDKEKDKKKISVANLLREILKNRVYIFGVITQAFYVGAQIMCWTSIFQLAEYLTSKSGTSYDASYFNLSAIILFFSTRFIGTVLMKNISPSFILTIFGFAASIFCIGVIFTESIFSLFCLVGVSVFMSIMFPTIFGISLYGMKLQTQKLASCGLIMAIVGGGIFPQFQAAIMDFGNEKVFGDKIIGNISEIQFSFIVPTVCLLVVALYGMYVTKQKKKEKISQFQFDKLTDRINEITNK